MELLGFSLPDGYEVSINVFNELVKLKKETIERDKLEQIVSDCLEHNYSKEIAQKYILIEKWKRSNTPIWILIAGAIGCGKST